MPLPCGPTPGTPCPRPFGPICPLNCCSPRRGRFDGEPGFSGSEGDCGRCPFISISECSLCIWCCCCFINCCCCICCICCGDLASGQHRRDWKWSWSNLHMLRKSSSAHIISGHAISNLTHISELTLSRHHLRTAHQLRVLLILTHPLDVLYSVSNADRTM